MLHHYRPPSSPPHYHSSTHFHRLFCSTTFPSFLCCSKIPRDQDSSHAQAQQGAHDSHLSAIAQAKHHVISQHHPPSRRTAMELKTRLETAWLGRTSGTSIRDSAAQPSSNHCTCIDRFNHPLRRNVLYEAAELLSLLSPEILIQLTPR